jgi:hypothetical protein
VVVGTGPNGNVIYELHPHKEFIVEKKDLVSLFQKSTAYHEVANMLPQLTVKRGTNRPARQKVKIKASQLAFASKGYVQMHEVPERTKRLLV